MVGSFAAGDAIEHVQITLAGQIWVGYFDEGVLSDDHLFTSALVRLDAEGTVTFRLHPDLTEQVPAMGECYSMNFADEHLWVCYDQNVLARISDADLSVQVYPVPEDLTLAHVIAVDGERVLFGAISRRPGEVVLYDTATGDQETLVVLTPEGELMDTALTACRGSKLYYLVGHDVLCVDLRQICGKQKA